MIFLKLFNGFSRQSEMIKEENMKLVMKSICLLILSFLSLGIYSQNTESLMLSGSGLGNTVTWDFYCSGGMNSGKWSKIEVPSQWELQGFGEYTYGRWYKKKGVKNPSMETGLYRRTFKIPKTWKGKQVSIVFEGVMTDAEVKVNSQLAGAMHQGGFYRFTYDITDKLEYGKKNELEVKVWKHSANKSVNAAERRADWWLFGGIYRPVYLEVKPKTNIERIAVDASADGNLLTQVFFSQVPEGYSLRTSLLSIEDGVVIGEQTTHLEAGTATQLIQTRWADIKTWTPESPNLYLMNLELLDGNKEAVHSCRQRIGFRTVEFRPRDGIYVNGTKIIMKGVNRHSFHPDGGRTTNREVSLQDVRLMKEMNMNAVRFHYPPDSHFLEVCDSLGLFVIDELAGWQNRYDTEVGLKLQKEMLIRDVNHPCIVLWSNGNEGGWNTELDKHFADYDLQKRHVIHPWADFDGLDTHHYPAYLTGVARFTNGYKVFMPTEFMHGQYDQGHGAGLEDFWNNYTSHPLFAGGFMWEFCDNAVKRVDKGGILDSDDFNAPDGIVGPRREKEGSFYTVREVWSPIQFKKLLITPSFRGEFMVTNAFLFTNLRDCRMKYRLYTVSSPLNGEKQQLLTEGEVKLPALEPGETGKANMILPENFFKGDVLELEAFNGQGESICNWTWPVKYADTYWLEQSGAQPAGDAAFYKEEDGKVVLSSGDLSVCFNTADGTLMDVRKGNKEIPFRDGPVAVGMRIRFTGYKVRKEGEEALFVANYLGGLDSIVWRMKANGLLHMDAVMLNRASGGGGFDDAFTDENILNFGLSFSYPEEKVTGMKWMGRGPYRVWKNRIKGTNYGLWDKAYNNTVTGESFENLVYPEFKGYHANLYWATIQSEGVPFTVYSESDGLFFRVFTPEEPKGRQDGIHTMPDFPPGDLSFLYDIPAIRSFKPISQHGPQSQPGSIRIKKGDEGIRMKLWFDFR